MKITKIEAIPYRMQGIDVLTGQPREGGWVSGLSKRSLQAGLKAQDIATTQDVLVRIHTDEGIVGLGESVGPIGDIVWTIREQIAPLLIGEDPTNTEKLLRKIDLARTAGGTTPFTTRVYIRTGVDIALHDISAKALNVPLHKLLGGALTDKMVVNWTIYIRKPEKMAKEAGWVLEHGLAKEFIIKVGLDPKQDIENVAAVRKEVGDDVPIKVDANTAYSVATAIRVAKQLEKHDVKYFEQPVKGWDFFGLAEVARKVDIPVCGDESVVAPWTVMLLARLDAIKFISFKLPRYGGIYPSKRMTHVAESADIQICMSCSKCPFDSAIGSSAALQFGASTTNATPAYDYSTHWLIDDIVKEPLKVKNGYIYVPNKPGLGLEVDEKKLEKYKIKKTC